jgi:hypothetical protein
MFLRIFLLKSYIGLQPILREVIDVDQFTFLPFKYILDNVLFYMLPKFLIRPTWDAKSWNLKAAPDFQH